MPVEKLCKNCISWTRCQPGGMGDKTHQGSCKNCNIIYSDNDCIAPLDGLVYWDQESWAAGINMGENFGCIHFEQKPPKPCNPRYICTVRNISYSCTLDSCILSKPMCKYCSRAIKGE